MVFTQVNIHGKKDGNAVLFFALIKKALLSPVGWERKVAGGEKYPHIDLLQRV